MNAPHPIGARLEAPLHSGIAEQGKVNALQGNHVEALRHYREALNLAVRARAPEVVFRHYLECSLESLEHMGSLTELLDYCDKAIAHYAQRPPDNPMAQLDLATIHQRRGVTLMKLGDRSSASQALTTALTDAKACGARLPLAEQLLRWLKAELTIAKDRLLAEQHRHRYFSVRKDSVKPERAVPLPPVLRASATPLARGGV